MGAIDLGCDKVMFKRFPLLGERVDLRQLRRQKASGKAPEMIVASHQGSGGIDEDNVRIKGNTWFLARDPSQWERTGWTWKGWARMMRSSFSSHIIKVLSFCVD